ncbi:MAG: VWA domain-containing protein [Byssovorax sp.]
MRLAPFAPLALAFAACGPTPHKPPVDPEPATTATTVAVSDPPARKAEEIVTLEAAPASRFVKADQRGDLVVRFELGANPAKDQKRPPINISLVVDTSGSMEGDAIKDARAASLALVDALAEGDRLSVVSFNSDTELLVPSTLLDKDSIATVKSRIEAMKARGTTDLAGGLRAGLTEVQKGFQQSGVNRVVLLGDGVPNDPGPIPALAQEAAQRRIPVTVMGLGLDYNETLMNTIAQTSGGHYHFIKESSKVASVFTDEVLRLKRVVARNTVFRVTPGPGVTIKEVIGLPTSASGTSQVVMLGDLGENEHRNVLVRLDVSGHRAGATVELLDAELSFEDATRGAARLSEKSFLGVRASADAAEITGGRNAEVEKAATRATLAARIVQAIALARSGQLPQAQSLLDQSEKEAKAAVKTLGITDLDEKLKGIPALRKSLASMAPPPMPPMPAGGPGGMPRPAAPPAPYAPADKASAAVVMDAQAAAVRAIEDR